MDELDDLLIPKPPPPEKVGLRDVVVQDAGLVQRRRRWLVRGRRAVILVACYAAGVASMWYFLPKSQLPRPEIVDRPTDPQPPAVADPFRNDPPERLEKWAFLQVGAKRVDLYRRAGDAYLVRDDVQGALRCYRRALDSGTTADLAIQAESDSWLLMSLKMARTKEKADARVN